MQIDIKTLNTIFALARLKQVELSPNDEEALITIINTKQQLLSALEELKLLKDNAQREEANAQYVRNCTHSSKTKK